MNAPLAGLVTRDAAARAAKTIARLGGAEAARLAERLAAETQGQVLFDTASRGRYATDASIYQVMPLGVFVPRTQDDVATAIDVARDLGAPVLMRGAGTSQCGQTTGAALVIDASRHLRNVLAFDREAMTADVEPGIVLDALNAQLKKERLWFPVDVSTSAQATIGGMAGNNSCGSRSIAYGNMVHNVLGIDAWLSDGSSVSFGPLAGLGAKEHAIAEFVRALAIENRAEIAAHWPKVLRRVAGYNLDIFDPQSELPYTRDGSVNLAHLLVGAEGTLAVYRSLKLQLAPLPGNKVLGVVNFPTFRAAMDSAQHLVKLRPTAVELVDRTMIDLARANPAFRPTIEAALIGAPAAILLVEFSGDDRNELLRRLRALVELVGDLGLPGAVVEMPDEGPQKALWEVRKAGLNIMMSLKGDGKPVSFIEDCAVPLEHLADYTSAITELFARHGTRGTWYAHASVGCLHVRPILDMKQAKDVRAMREIAEAACDLVRRFKGSHSGEHGDGISRSELHPRMFGERLIGAFEEVKDAFDPAARLNPGKIVRPYRMDDRALMRFPEGYTVVEPLTTALDWSEWGGFSGAVEMCNNNGTCRKLAGGTMCPSYRATLDEQHLTRGRANSLRLAISGQLGPDAFTSHEMKATLDLCVSCKGCRRECPTGVDMAKMKIEFLHHYYERHGRPAKEKLVAWLPRYAPYASRTRGILNLRDRIPGAARVSEAALRFSARRSMPTWKRPWREAGRPAAPEAMPGDGRDLVLFGDTFNRYFEPENLSAAERVLAAAGYRLHRAAPKGRPLCCGRTFLSAGLVDEAREEARRTLDALSPFVAAGCRVVGLEPSCLYTFRDEFLNLLPKAEVAPLAAASFLIEELLAADIAAGATALPLRNQNGRKAHLHGHCHQKAFGGMGAVESVLRAVPGLDVAVIESSCCGMAGAFGYDPKTIDVSFAMAELSLFPALRNASPDDLVVADGTSCRHQIHDGVGREAVHVARVLDAALA
ncbi:MAG: FAD-binding and (Fe-S)-binding domain-containing protein [Microvirga sp.]